VPNDRDHSETKVKPLIKIEFAADVDAVKFEL
jgi:hypothetical protein